jgi:hypothetical protein
MQPLPSLILLLPSLLALPGCLGFSSSPPRTYSYQVDLRNTSGSPVSVEFLRIQSGSAGKTRCDLAAGGVFSGDFTDHNGPEYLEARLRCLDDAKPHAPFWIVPIHEGKTRADIIFAHDHLALQARTDPAGN